MALSSEPEDQMEVPEWAYAVGLVLVILINLIIFLYLIVYWPYACSRLAVETAGRTTCGLQPGAYIVGAVNACIIFICLVLLFRWHSRRSGK